MKQLILSFLILGSAATIQASEEPQLLEIDATHDDTEGEGDNFGQELLQEAHVSGSLRQYWYSRPAYEVTYTCFAKDRYSRRYRSSGPSRRRAQVRAVRFCERNSYRSCRPLGCVRVVMD